MTLAAVIVLSTLTVALTSIVPLAIFFLLGPLFFNHPRRRTALLPMLVALAAGSLLGDVFFHLIPEIFHLPPSVLGRCTLMLLGVFVFLVGERLLQHYHQGHGHAHLPAAEDPSQARFSVLSTSERDPSSGDNRDDEIELELVPSHMADAGMPHRPAEPQLSPPHPEPCHRDRGNRRTTWQPSTKPMGLLILTSDFIHNFVDGIAIGVSYSSSLAVGLSTSIAVFLHEIPHELSDFAILLAAGYRPLTIVICNVLTALSSLLGVLLAVTLVGLQVGTGGIAGGAESFARTMEPLILSLTAGNFLYIALADLIPELLQGGTGEREGSCGQEMDGDEGEAGPIIMVPDAPSRSVWLDALMQYTSFLLGALAMYLIKVYSD